MQEMRVSYLGHEDPLEKEMATHSGILAWKIPLTEEPGGLQFMEPQRVGHDLAIERAHTHTHTCTTSPIHKIIIITTPEIQKYHETKVQAPHNPESSI